MEEAYSTKTLILRQTAISVPRTARCARFLLYRFGHKYFAENKPDLNFCMERYCCLERLLLPPIGTKDYDFPVKHL